MSDWSKYDGVKLPSLESFGPALDGLGQILSADDVIDTGPSLVDCFAEIDYLASLLDGVLADDPQAIRDAAAWLTTNRPLNQ